MAKKISELTAVTSLDGTETLPVVQSSTTKKATIDDIVPIARTAAEISAGVTPVDYRYVEGHPRRYGAKIDNSTDDYTAFANAVAVCEAAKINMPRWAGTALLSQKLTLTSTIIRGYGGHLSLSVLKCTATDDDAILIAGRSAGLDAIRIDASSTRRSTGDYTDGGVKVRPASGTSISRLHLRDVYITNQPGYGLYTVGTLELANIKTVTAEGCKGHPFVFDDGTYDGSVIGGRPFETTFSGLRALYCGGNVHVGYVGQTSGPFNLTFDKLEALDCAFDSGIRERTEQIIVRCQGAVFNHLDVENQNFAADEDSLGNSKTELLAPVNGAYVAAQQVEFHKPFFSNLTKSVDVISASSNCFVYDPVISAGSGSGGTTQTVGITVAGTTGFTLRAVTGSTGGATTLIQNQSVNADIRIDGVPYVGLATTSGDYNVGFVPTERTISSGTLDSFEEHVLVTGEGDANDTLSTIRLTSGINGYAGLKKFLHYNGDDITINNTGTIKTQSGSDITLNSSRTVIGFVFDGTDWMEL